jgi:putative transposase
MNDHQSLSPTKGECKDHGGFIPKARRQVWSGPLRRYLGEVSWEVARQTASTSEAGHLPPDPVQILLSIPPKDAVAQVVGYRKGQRALHLARTDGGRERKFVGEPFWARGSFVSPGGRDEETIGRSIQEQEAEDKRLEQLELFKK